MCYFLYFPIPKIAGHFKNGLKITLSAILWSLEPISRKLPCFLSSRCSKCNLPLCDAKCESRGTHRLECSHLSKHKILSPESGEDLFKDFDLITPLRCILLKGDKDSSAYEAVLKLEDNLEAQVRKKQRAEHFNAQSRNLPINVIIGDTELCRHGGLECCRIWELESGRHYFFEGWNVADTNFKFLESCRNIRKTVRLELKLRLGMTFS